MRLGSPRALALGDRLSDSGYIQESQPAVRQGLRPWQLALAGLALFVLALAPRLVALEQHLTADDREWIRDTSRFSVALREGRLHDTYQRGHPGVPVLWLATLSIGPERSAELARQAANPARLVNVPSFVGAIFDARRALGWTSAALTVMLTFLVWRLLGPGPALLAGLLLVGEPFLVAHGRLFHADPLLGHLMAVAVAAALVFFLGRGGRAYLVGSGVAAGLALLTKAPGIFLFGFIPLLGLISSAWGGRGLGWRRLRRLAPELLLWALTSVAAYVALWPALWVDPADTLNRLLVDLKAEGLSARPNGNFFLGQAVDEDVGPLFYPVATLLRLSPITLAGLILLALGGLQPQRSKWRDEHGQARWRLPALLIATYVALFTLMMTILPKKIDRYLLPAYPMLVVLGAIGLWMVLRRRLGPAARWAAVIGLGVGQAALVFSVHPYPLSFFNPLLGGSQLAREIVVVGWGEGTEQVAAYLDQQPNAANIVVTSLYNHLIDAQFTGRGVRLPDWRQADYLADYVNMDQRHLVPGPLVSLVRTQSPVLTVRINGLEYVRVYRIPPELK
jgi:hypothetical protein